MQYKAVIASIFILFAPIGLTDLIAQSTADSSSVRWIIEVTSPNSDETVEFDGAYLLYDKDEHAVSSISLVSGKTPYKMTKTADGFSGTFKAMPVGSQMEVTLSMHANGLTIPLKTIESSIISFRTPKELPSVKDLGY